MIVTPEVVCVVCLIEPLSNSRGAAHLRYSLCVRVRRVERG